MMTKHSEKSPTGVSRGYPIIEQTRFLQQHMVRVSGMKIRFHLHILAII
jgi:hypothetical protein